MKTTRLLWGILFLCMTEIWATTIIKDVQIAQRWPWNGLVDITYFVECDEVDNAGNPVEIQVSFMGYDSDRKADVTMKSLCGDGVSNPVTNGGPYTAIWDAEADYPNFHSSAFSVKVQSRVALSTNYVVIDLSAGADATNYPIRHTNEEPDLSNDTCRTTELWLRRIPAGTAILGAPDDEIGQGSSSGYPNYTFAQHSVTLTQDFYIGIFETTQRQWELIMGNRPSKLNNNAYYATRPVENLSYDMIRGNDANGGGGWPSAGHSVDADSFMGVLRSKTGLLLDLPTDSQWEYACRAGTTTALNTGKNLTAVYYCDNMDEVGRYRGNNDDGSSESSASVNLSKGSNKVGSYLPNALGLYDMHGNLWEWCLDWTAVNKSTASVVDPVGPETGIDRVRRGGSYVDPAAMCRSSVRDQTCEYPAYRHERYGFRIAYLPCEDTPAYVVIDLSEGADADSYPIRYTNDDPDLSDDTCRTTELWLRRIPAGTFIMGSPEDELGHEEDEVQHQVTLTKDFYIGVFECTAKQWNLIKGNSGGGTTPATSISYNDLRGADDNATVGWPTFGHTVADTSFLAILRDKTGLCFDLPTEAQWEYACRAGTTTALNSGKNLTSLTDCPNMSEVGRYGYNGGGVTTVGSYLPNAWNLYDMHGNALEWCLDYSGEITTEAVVDPVGPSSPINTSSYGGKRIYRSGWWGNFWDRYARWCRSAARDDGNPVNNFSEGCHSPEIVGFRLAIHTEETSGTTLSSAQSSNSEIDVRSDFSNQIVRSVISIAPTADEKTDTAIYLDDNMLPSSSLSNWDSTSVADGWHTLVLDDGESTTVRSIFVLNSDNVQLHSGVLTGNETWQSGKVHIVTNHVRIPSGKTLNIANDAVVKFCSAAGIETDGTLNATNVTFTTLSDDTIGGDTDMNGLTTIFYDDYSLTGNGIMNLVNCDIRYLSRISLTNVSTQLFTHSAIPWTSQSEITHDGTSAWQSGTIGHNGNTSISTTVMGQGSISFFWKSSSESGYDELRFYVDGTEIAQISGEHDWEEYSHTITEDGQHLLKWEYAKDGSASSGSDCGWIDEINWTTSSSGQTPSQSSGQEIGDGLNYSSLTWRTGGTPSVTGENVDWHYCDDDGVSDGNCVCSGGGGAGNAISWLKTTVTGPCKISYYYKVQTYHGEFSVTCDSTSLYNYSGATGLNTQWQYAEYDIPSGTHELTFTYHHPGMGYSYEFNGAKIDMFKINGAGTSSGSITTVSLETSTDKWYEQNEIVHDASSAWQSNSIGDSSSTYMEATVTGPGTLSFFWKVSSESSYDKLKFYVDGNVISNISGSVDWTQVTYAITSSEEHTIRWEYSKDSSVSSGSDCGWVADIKFSKEKQVYSLAVNGGTGTGQYAPGTTVSVRAIPSTSRMFCSWETDGIDLTDEQKTSATLALVMPNGNATLTALTQPKTNLPDWEYFLDDNGNANITAYNGSERDLVIPTELDGHPVTAITSNAFGENRTITSITLPITIKMPAENPFSGCVNLTTVNYTLDDIRMDFGSNVKVNVEGMSPSQITVELNPGWNLIALPQGELTTESLDALEALENVFVYDFTKRLYHKTDTFEAGKPYWIYTERTIILKTKD